MQMQKNKYILKNFMAKRVQTRGCYPLDTWKRVGFYAVCTPVGCETVYRAIPVKSVISNGDLK